MIETVAYEWVSNAWGQFVAIFLATFVTEDLTCISTGLLIRRGEISPLLGVSACFFGILIGDIGLWLIGRCFGPRALNWKWLRRSSYAARIDGWSSWFERQGWMAVLAARFMPGTRVLIYVTAGALGHGLGRFLFWAAVACLLWTPPLVLLVAWLGDQVVRPVESYLGRGWMALATAALILLVVIRVLGRMATDVGRARLWARISKVWRWEFWPMWIFYVPLLPYLIYLAIRHGGATVPTVSNPGIPHGGIVGESKFEILKRLPSEWTATSRLIPSGPIDDRTATLERFLADAKVTFPIILKPDAGQRGMGVKLIRKAEDVPGYLLCNPAPILAQAYHAGPFEAGIFYYRHPHEDAGHLLSITDKHFAFLRGDGRSSIERLIWMHPRFRMQAKTFLARLGTRGAEFAPDRVLGDGEEISIGVAGNHCQGTLFRDGSQLMTPQLEKTIDAISRSFPGFYFGRYDVRYSDPEELRQGRGFTIIELNGATSESTNIYDPSWSLWRAYSVLFRQWRLLFEIGAANRKNGYQVTPIGTLWREIRRFYRTNRPETIAD